MLMIVKADSVFSGISTFGRLPYYPCLASNDVKYDIAFIGVYYAVDRFTYGKYYSGFSPKFSTSAFRDGFRVGKSVTNREQQQVPLSILGLLTDLEHVLGLLAFVKVLAA
jgi:hypothetical protein